MDNNLKKGYFESPWGYNNVNWFENEVIKLENKMVFYFKNTKEDIIMTKENEEKYKKSNFCRWFCEKESFSDNVSDHCHLTGKNRRPDFVIKN